MENIITIIHNIIKDTDNLIAFKETIRNLRDENFTELVSDAFIHLYKVIKESTNKEEYSVERNDSRTIQFSFGAVTYNRTLIKNNRLNESFYPLDKRLGFRKYQRYSPFVEVKTAELLSKSDCHESAIILSEWTPGIMSHKTIGTIVKRIGQAQAEADKRLVDKLEITDHSPEAKKADFLYAEADGVFVHGTKQKRHHEFYHGITYEDWRENGERVLLVNPSVMLTTRGVNLFWKVVQANSAYRYSSENTQIITNSDGGSGYSAERFEEAFAQSNHSVLNQLDPYHIKQAIK